MGAGVETTAPPLTAPRLPIWVMGLAMAPFGLLGGVWAVTTPQLLASQHVPEPMIATVTALSGLPTSVGFLASPVLDVWISRRAWTLGLAVLTGLLLFAALLCHQSVLAIGAFLFLAWFSAILFAGVAGAWLSSLLPQEKRASLAAWSTVGNTGAGGLAVFIAMPLLRDLPFLAGAAVLGLAVMAPVLPLLLLEAPPPDARLSNEGLTAFLRDLRTLATRPHIVRLLILFLAPAAAFSLTNLLGGLGDQFRASERFVSTVGGAGVTVAGIIGSLLVPRLLKLTTPVRLYLLIGSVGALFTAGLLLAPHGPATFAVAMIGENAFQAAAFTASFAITFRSVGTDNPLAATQVSLLTGAGNGPITYMQILDGRAYGAAGIAGAFAFDSAVSLVACAIMALWLWRRQEPDLPDGSGDAGAVVADPAGG
ncbi:MAG: MFS transporter [Caulobacteraceae bacterium]|nr:MFS transporter [Caulobacteraceae bacterium]